MAFGNQRAFGGSLGVAPSQMLGGGWALGMGGQQLPTVLGNQLVPRGRPSLFSADPMAAFSAAQNNMGSLERMGDQAYLGNQARMDRDLENNLLQQRLRNALQLQGMQGQNNLDVQGLVNSGALDQINARGGWEQALLGRRLSSEELRAANQLGFSYADLQGRLGESRADRESLNQRHAAGLQNALDLQGMQDTSAMGRLRAQLTGNETITGMEQAGAMARQQLLGEQANEQIGLRGQVERGHIRARGQVSQEELAADAGYKRQQQQMMNDWQGGQNDAARGLQRDLGLLNAGNTAQDIANRHEVGMGGVNAQLAEIEAGRAEAAARAAQWAQEHALRKAANDLTGVKTTAEIDDMRARAARAQQQLEAEIEAAKFARSPEGRKQRFGEVIAGREDVPISSVPSLAGSLAGVPGENGQLQSSMAPLMPAERAAAIKETQGFGGLSDSSLYQNLSPILDSVQLDQQGRISPEDEQLLDRMGVTPEMLNRYVRHTPWMASEEGGWSQPAEWLLGESRAERLQREMRQLRGQQIGTARARARGARGR